MELAYSRVHELYGTAPRTQSTDLLREVGPLLPVGEAAVEERLDPGERLRQRRVQRPAHHVDEAHLAN